MLAAGLPCSTIKVWMSFSNEAAGVMVNLENVSNFQVVLDDFLLPCLNQQDGAGNVHILCPPTYVDIWRDWAPSHRVSLILLPPFSNDLNPCDLLWRKICYSLKHLKFVSKAQLWEEVADSFDRLILCAGIRFVAASSMCERLEKVQKEMGGPISY